MSAVITEREPSEAAWERAGGVAARVLENLARREIRAEVEWAALIAA